MIEKISCWEFSWENSVAESDVFTMKFIHEIVDRLYNELEGCLSFYNTYVLRKT